MFTLFFNKSNVYDYNSALKSNLELFRKYFRLMLENQIYIPPSQFETNFLSSAHSDKDIEKTIKAFETIFSKF